MGVASVADSDAHEPPISLSVAFLSTYLSFPLLTILHIEHPSWRNEERTTLER